MIIEKLKVEDFLQVLELYSIFIFFEILFDKLFEIYKEMLINENYYLVVVKEDNEVIGFVIGICCKCLVVFFLVIEDVVVKEGLRGKGIG